MKSNLNGLKIKILSHDEKFHIVGGKGTGIGRDQNSKGTGIGRDQNSKGTGIGRDQ